VGAVPRKLFLDVHWCGGSLLCWCGKRTAEVCAVIVDTPCITQESQLFVTDCKPVLPSSCVDVSFLVCFRFG
jgi:hypothetical protein